MSTQPSTDTVDGIAAPHSIPVPAAPTGLITSTAAAAPTTAPAAPTTQAAPATVAEPDAPTLDELLAFAKKAAADPELIARLRTLPDERSWIPLDGPAGSEAWVIGWPPGAETGWHDHGGSVGAFVTAVGALHESSLAVPLPGAGWSSLELLPDLDRERTLSAGAGRAFGAHHVHQVVNPSQYEHAISVHVYYPPLPLIRRYSRRGRVLGLETVERPEQW
ncbi:MAG TPA: hypothetical protein VH372_13360 [Actinospica sp.]|jgi:hypothetical protein|nr:hypothetical protein [Actinospica sp.]